MKVLRLFDGITRIKRIEAIGNGWTVDVITHIFKGLKENEQ